MTKLQNIMDLQDQIRKLTSKKDAQYNFFMFMGGEDEHSKLLDLENDLKILNLKLIELYTENNISSNNNLTYAITIGSAEKDNIQPCLHMWNHFLSSADAKDFLDYQAFFEKGENGYIHIHAYITKSHKFRLSKKELGQRHGKYNGKQHNFDIKRLIGIEIIKWQQYIKKDSKFSWNLSVNNTLKNAEEASILSDATELAM